MPTKAVADALRALYGTDDPDGERAARRLPDRDDFDGWRRWESPDGCRVRWQFYCNRAHPTARRGLNRFQTGWETREYAERLADAHLRRHHPDLELREAQVG